MRHLVNQVYGISVEALVRQIERDAGRMKPPLDPAIVRGLRQRLRLG